MDINPTQETLSILLSCGNVAEKWSERVYEDLKKGDDKSKTKYLEFAFMSGVLEALINLYGFDTAMSLWKTLAEMSNYNEQTKTEL